MGNKKRTLKIVEVASNALEIQFNDGETLCEFSSANDDYISSDCREKAELVLLSVNAHIKLLESLKPIIPNNDHHI